MGAVLLGILPLCAMGAEWPVDGPDRPVQLYMRQTERQDPSAKLAMRTHPETR
jgi:hypothetical protein